MFDKINFAPQHLVFAAFFVYSLALGGIFPRIGDIQTSMGVGEGALGGALIGAAFGTQIALMFAGPLIERVGYRAILLVAIPALSALMALATLMPTPTLLFGVLAFAGLAIGAIEIVMNVEADRTEYRLSKRLMNRAHAFWSFGFFTAGLIGALAKHLEVSPFIHLSVMVVLITLASFLVLFGFEPAPERPSEKTQEPRFVRPTKGILLLVTFTLSAMLLEGAGSDWSVIYMRDIFATTPFISAFAFAIGAFCQAVVRFFADQFVDRYGPLRVARLLVVTLGIGAVFVSFASHPAIALIGFGLMGVGTSAIFPLAMSAAAQRTDRPASVNVAAVAQLSFITFLVAPPMLGYVAEHFGIRVSFGIGIPLVILSWFTLHVLEPATQD